MTTRLTLNGRPVTVDVPPDTPLLWTIRDALGLDPHQIRLRNWHGVPAPCM